MSSFLQTFGDIPLRELFADWQLRPMGEDDAQWLNFPPREFLDWVRSFPRYPQFDGVPPSSAHKCVPSFLLCQAHGVWLKSQLAARYLSNEKSLIDFGSFPFCVPLALRSYFNFRGPILATAIQDLSADTCDVLDRYDIQLGCVDLDPMVVDRDRREPPPDRLARPDCSCDVVTMFHVIEHLYHPMPALREAFRLLRRAENCLSAPIMP